MKKCLEIGHMQKKQGSMPKKREKMAKSQKKLDICREKNRNCPKGDNGFSQSICGGYLKENNTIFTIFL